MEGTWAPTGEERSPEPLEDEELGSWWMHRHPDDWERKQGICGLSYGVRSTEHQYLQEWGPGLVGCLTERQSLSPHLHCQPTPDDAPDRSTRRTLVFTVWCNEYRWSPFTIVYVCYLSLSDAVNDGLQRFMRVTLQHPLHAAGSGRDGLPHRHVQVVVVLLGRQVLQETKKKESDALCWFSFPTAVGYVWKIRLCLRDNNSFIVLWTEIV